LHTKLDFFVEADDTYVLVKNNRDTHKHIKN